MYAQCGDLQSAREVFDSIPDQNLYSWNILFSGYAQNGHLDLAVEIFHHIPRKNIVSWNAMLQAFVQGDRIREARDLFDRMRERDIVSWNSIVTGYARLGHLGECCDLFHQMPEKNTISWNAMVSASAQNGHAKLALGFFRAMDLEGFLPDRVTAAGVISACSSLGDLWEGRSIHESLAAVGLEREAIVVTSLVNFYGKCGSLEEVEALLPWMPSNNMVGWTAAITAYGHHGWLRDARGIFDALPVRVAATWNAMLSAYAQNGQLTQALGLFREMDLDGVRPNVITIIAILDACLNASALNDGILVHESIKCTDLASDPAVRTGMLNMYAKCGNLRRAADVFAGMSRPNVVAWNAILSAHTQAGCNVAAIELFHVMLLEGNVPDGISFLSLLSACSHAGRLEDGIGYFVSLQRDFGIVPEVSLFGCVVDLLARGGWLEICEELIETMPASADVVAWISLVGGCKVFGDFKRAARAAERAFVMDPENSAPYMLLSSMYGSARNKEDAEVALRAMEAVKPKSMRS
ncbi:pentatricopeptide repeat-containing protein At2g13600-like [Selaginella moellendorffii]|uniref:pentatricopeptide repeat-containing protein At2g13600-like n=1 Tax=Selaginella moellendorffii TaxID=88036 RepID=UPI000D1CFE1F|nr:pentatricopeptide repeat-containing protein At2g13600-like [Selaginella moellendorffii]|eukprot:XP_024539964.1 pentatricopeptide repeat-containing protein At2g13600-like [Selaginella moellendorffii]